MTNVSGSLVCPIFRLQLQNWHMLLKGRTHELCYIFKGILGYVCIVISSCILITRRLCLLSILSIYLYMVLITIFKEGAGKFRSMRFRFLPYLKKLLEMASFGSQTRVTHNKWAVHCTSKQCIVNDILQIALIAMIITKCFVL